MRRTLRRGDDNSLISLINVVFLILVFFMIMGRIAPDDLLDIDPPASTSTLAVEPDSITILIGPDGRISVGSKVVTKASLHTALQRETRVIEPGGRPQVTIKADGHLQIKNFNDTFEILRTLGMAKISLVTDRTR